MPVDRELLERCLPGYEIGEELGRGGWGVVMYGRHRKLGREVAVKLLPGAFGADPSVRDRFLVEAQIVASLDHPHLVPLFDYVEYDGACVIVMELLSGGTLWDRMTGGGVAPADAVAATLAALVGLDHAHERGVLHRDLKPENLLFSSQGVLKIADFGIAKQADERATPLTVAGSIIGTPAYMAPEQAGAGALGPGTDVYSMAVVLYEMLAGTLPVDGSGDVIAQLVAKATTDPVPLAQTAPSLDGPIDAVLMRALARDPQERFGSSMAFATELAQAATVVFGPGWLHDTPITVLGAGRIVAITDRPTVDHHDPAPTNAAGTTPSAAATPAAPPTATGLAPPAPPSRSEDERRSTSAETVVVPGPVGAPAPQRSRGLVVGAAAALVVIVGLVVAFVLLAGGDDDPATDEATTGASAEPAPTANGGQPVIAQPPEPVALDPAMRRRFIAECTGSGVDPATCACAADEIAQLSPTEVRDGMAALPEVTVPFDAALVSCLPEEP